MNLISLSNASHSTSPAVFQNILQKVSFRVARRTDEFVSVSFVTTVVWAVLPSGVHSECVWRWLCINDYNETLKEFRTVYWNLTEIPSDIPAEAELVDLSDNLLVNVPADSFKNLTKLKTLDLSVNQIAFIEDGAFNGLDSIEKVDLRANQIVSIGPGTFKGLKNLNESLNLGYNRLTSIPPGTFKDLGKLEGLWLWQNLLTSFEPGTWEGLKSLKMLYIFHNSFPSLGKGYFSGLGSLELLHVADSEVVSIHPEAFTPLRSLKELHIYGNNLTVLSPELFINVPRPFTLIINIPFESTDQPWNCSALCWLKKEERDGTVQWHVFLNRAFMVECDGVSWASLQCDEEQQGKSALRTQRGTA